MELVMGGLLIGVSGMLVLLVVAAWNDLGSRQTDTHPLHREV